MLFIQRNLPAIEQARLIHGKNVVCRILMKVRKGKCADSSCKICSSRVKIIENIPTRLFNIVKDRGAVQMIIDCAPEDQLNVTEMVWEELVDTFSWDEYNSFLISRRKRAKNRDVDDNILMHKYSTFYDYLVLIFDYDIWFQNSNDEDRYDAYVLASNLNRNTCMYCNRIYTSTMKSYKRKKVMRPTFDHWYSKSKHPLLALSYYNLIPSCSICNSSVKRDANFDVRSHLHPYIDSINDYTYSYDYFKSTQIYKIKIKSEQGSSRVFSTYNDLKLIDIYNSHHSELADMLRLKKAYTERYIENMLRAYPEARLSHKEVYRLAFGTELNSADFHKKPLSKFKKDILSELGLLNFL